MSVEDRFEAFADRRITVAQFLDLTLDIWIDGRDLLWVQSDGASNAYYPDGTPAVHVSKSLVERLA